VIGHQPTLGQVASLLITGEKQDWTIRKGNVWWIVQRERGETTGNYIRAVMTADLLTK
jgi:phosphohistidine phosphatase